MASAGTTTGASRPARRWRVLRFTSLLLLVALALTTTVSYAQGGNQGPGNGVHGVVGQPAAEDRVDEPFVYGHNLNHYGIPDGGVNSSPITITTAPAGAKVTRIKYTCLVSATGFMGGPGQYTLDISTHLGTSQVIWNRQGGETDEGHDDDAADDRDIYLDGRWVDVTFDGQPVNQEWWLRAWDHVPIVMGGGQIDFWQLVIYYCTAAPGASTSIEPGNGTNTCNTMPTFDWRDVSGAGRYQLQVDDDPIFTSPEINASLLNSQYTPHAALARKQWYWRARAYNECGYGPWSETKNFYIDWFAAAPLLQSPASGSHTCDPTPTFDWGFVPGLTYYYIQVDDDASFASPVIGAAATLSEYTAPASLPPGRYYWRVRSHSSCSISSWSEVRDVYVDPAPAMPSGPSPASGASGVSTNANLDWADAANATSYDVHFGMTTAPPRVANVTVSAYDLPRLQNGREYFWQIVATDSCGTTTGPLWRFTTASLVNHAPENVNLWPDHGGRPAGRRVNFTATYRDREGWRDLRQVYLQIGSASAKRLACRLRYDVRQNKMYLLNNAGTAWLGGFAPGSARGIRNRQCLLSCAKSTVTKSGRVLKVKWNLALSPSFKGRKNSYMHAADNHGVKTPWEKMGIWRVE